MASSSMKRITATWIITLMILFVLAIIFGIILRLNQGNHIDLGPREFYSIMTSHGMTMIGIWTVAGLVAVHYLMQRYVRTSVVLGWGAFAGTVLGVVLLWISTFIGKFHGGWTFLYPLPFYVAWQKWATPVFLISLSVLTVTWIIWSVGLLRSVLKIYPLRRALAWPHISRREPAEKTPPFILISTVTLIGILVSLATAVILFALLFLEFFSDGVIKNDPLLMKNLTYFFGHTVANEALYLGLAVLYELMPELSGQPKFKNTWYVALGWNLTMIFILTAFFHHMYMDFVQPEKFQIIGQMASYFASLPAAAVTVLSVITLIYRRRIQWPLSNILFLLGITGWVIGGIGALIDSTISNNMLLHNTMWVPAHFHTYNAMGNVLFCLAFFTWVSSREFFPKYNDFRYQKWLSILLLVGGFGFVLAFYLAGADSIPRRFASYPEELNTGVMYATMGACFAVIYLVAMVWLTGDILKKCIRFLFVRS